MIELRDYIVFQKVVETKSFSKAAKQLHLSQPSVSRIIKELEDNLKSALIRRTTKSIHITQKGEALYQRLKGIVTTIESIEHSIREDAHTISGVLKGTLPIFLPNTFYSLFSLFLEQYPKVVFQNTISNSFHNIKQEGLDFAIRIDPSLKKRPQYHYIEIARRKMVTVASPSYLASHAKIQHPQDLAHHNCLMYSPGDKWSEWIYAIGKENVTIPVQGNWYSSSMIPIIDLVIAGSGLSYLPYYYVQPYIQKGLLNLVLCDYYPESHPVYYIYPKQPFIPNTVKALETFLIKHAPRYFFEP